MVLKIGSDESSNEDEERPHSGRGSEISDAAAEQIFALPSARGQAAVSCGPLGVILVSSSAYKDSAVVAPSTAQGRGALLRPRISPQDRLIVSIGGSALS